MYVTNVLGHKNQYQVSLDGGALVKFQSYDTHICTILKGCAGCVCLTMVRNTWSVTTAKHFVAVLKDNYAYIPALTLIEHKVFKNMKDLMYRLQSFSTDNHGIVVEYKDENGNLINKEINW